MAKQVSLRITKLQNGYLVAVIDMAKETYDEKLVAHTNLEDAQEHMRSVVRSLAELMLEGDEPK